MPNDILLTQKITSLVEIVELLDEVGCRYPTNDIMIKTVDCFLLKRIYRFVYISRQLSY
jgi:hypothetical protein